MGFFGEIIGAEKREVIIPEGHILYLNASCLAPSSEKYGWVTLWLQPAYENNAFIIARLHSESHVQNVLGQELSPADGPIHMWVTGGGCVHVTGRWFYEHEEESDEQEDYEEEEDSESEEDADARIERAIKEEEFRQNRKNLSEDKIKNVKRVRVEHVEAANSAVASTLRSALPLQEDESEWEMMSEGDDTTRSEVLSYVNKAPSQISDTPSVSVASLKATSTGQNHIVKDASNSSESQEKKTRKRKKSKEDKIERLEKLDAIAMEQAELAHYDSLVKPVAQEQKLTVEKARMRAPWKVKPVDNEGLLVPAPKQVARPNGVLITDYVIGAGKEPRPGSRVQVTYEGMFPDGTVFDKNLKRSQPLIFRKGAGEVVRGLDYGLESMRVGGSREIVVPAALG